MVKKISAAALVAAALALPAAVANGATSVNVKLSDFKVTPSAKSVRHGRVTFRVTNASSMEHEFVVIKTSRKAAALPVHGGEASEKGSVGEVELGRHKRKSITLHLKKGHYALICNVQGHFMAGMHADLTVR